MWFDGPRIPLLFEALPTRREADAKEQAAHVERLRPLGELELSAINVPQIVGGHYDTVEPRAFAAALQGATSLPAIVNKITVLQSEDRLVDWLESSRKTHGIEHFVFVGGESSQETYPGPSVTQALAAARTASAGTLGVITIPTRRRPVLDEPARLLAKQAAGADHAISQILMESGSATALQHDLAVAASQAGVACLPLFWSLAPVVREKDIAFLEWLGVEIPSRVRVHLREASSQAQRLARSLTVAEVVARDLLEHAEQQEHGPVGFCIEHVMQSNTEPALQLVERLQDVCDEFRGLAAAPELRKRAVQ